MAEMTRVDYYDDPNAPQANSLVPGGSAIVVGPHGEILLQRRADNDRWALPGGTMDIGETLADAVIREGRIRLLGPAKFAALNSPSHYSALTPCTM